MHAEIFQHAKLIGVDRTTAAAVRKELTVPNPKYYELERLKKWTGDTPRELKLYTTIQQGNVQSLEVPRAYGAKIARDLGGAIVDKTLHTHLPRVVGFAGDDRDYQIAAAEAAAARAGGLIIAPTGAGKTAIGCRVIHERQVHTLVVVHTKMLLEQWVKALSFFLEIPVEDIGVVGGGKFKLRPITVGIINSLASKVDQLGAFPFSLYLFDECHHAPAKSYVDFISAAPPARFRYGLTATLMRRDRLTFLLEHHLGPVLYEISRKQVEEAGGIVPAKVYPFTYDLEWGELIERLVSDEKRNKAITKLTSGLAETAPVLLLTDRVEHAMTLWMDLVAARPASDPVAILHGKQGAREQRTEKAKLAAGCSITVATTAFIGEGVDEPMWHSVVMALPSSSQSPRSLQAIGRAVRPAPGKTHAVIYDVVDGYDRAKKSWYGRKSLYKKSGIEVFDV